MTTFKTAKAWAEAGRKMRSEQGQLMREMLRPGSFIPCDAGGNVTPTGDAPDMYEITARSIMMQCDEDKPDTGEARRIGKVLELAMGYGGQQESKLKTKADILNEAIETVKGRGLNYGKPEDNFQRIALLWNAHMVNRFGSEAAPVFTPQDVSMMMILLKVARLENSPDHHDSWVDVAGYAACGGEIAASPADERN